MEHYDALICHNYKISAQVSILPFETDKLDNKLDDGYVKIKIMGDIAIVAQALGSYPGHPRWNPEADLNRDGKVDIVDLAMVASNFGKTCSS